MTLKEDLKTVNYLETVPLLVKARELRLVFYRRDLHGEIWFTPDELEEQMKNGWYCWGPDVWTLRHPAEIIRDAVVEAEINLREATKKFDRMMEKM
jgi:hypothetical protein